MTIAKRLALGAAITLAVMLSIFAAAWTGMSRLSQQTEKLVELDWAKADATRQIADAANEVGRMMLLVLLDPQATVDKQKIQGLRAKVEELLPKLEKMAYTEKGKAIVAEFKARRQAFAELYPKVVGLLESGKREEAVSLFLSDGLPKLKAYLQAATDFQALQGELFEKSGREAAETAANVTLWLLFFSLAGMLVAGVTSLLVARAVLRPLGGEPGLAQQAVQRVAQGDLTDPVRVAAGSEDSLLGALAGMQRQLNGMVGSLVGDSQALRRAAEELAAASGQVAAGSGTQSDAASSMASAIEQLSTSVSQLNDSANAAREQMAANGELSRHGNQVITGTVSEMRQMEGEIRLAAEAMREMGERSGQISGVVQVIREVAEQTNLLALNAAIEAARAGEAGRGFAVVADEVRKLAERTAAATTEITSMISMVQHSVDAATGRMDVAVRRVESGVTMAEEASGSISGLSEGAERVLSAINDISGALEEQKSASHDVAVNVEKIARMAEENSAAARQAAATAGQLQQLARSVETSVGHFRV